MGTHVLSLRVDGELLERLRGHAAKRGMSVQDYVIGTLVRDDFDERFQSAVEETERFYAGADGDADGAAGGRGGPDGETVPLSRAATGTTVAGTGTLSMTALRAASATDPAAPSDPADLAHPATSGT
ncbi:BrnA antitoxin family protein [Streptomyces uncialis]|nr:BrnA antitoxin family protein [Streptomyces uncialis]